VVKSGADFTREFVALSLSQSQLISCRQACRDTTYLYSTRFHTASQTGLLAGLACSLRERRKRNGICVLLKRFVLPFFLFLNIKNLPSNSHWTARQTLTAVRIVTTRFREEDSTLNLSGL
jgi:hypothetical protein